MSEKQSRRLAALLFADIQGYTALMGENEGLASTLLRKFQGTIERVVVDHQGQVVNLYGDGALCTFDNPLDAVNYVYPDLPNPFSRNLKVRIQEYDKSVYAAFQFES